MNPPLRYADQVVGILLAAGRGARFDAAGVRNKLLQPLPGAERVVERAAKNLLSAVPAVLAVVRPGAEEVALRLQALGCDVTVCAEAHEGMGVSLVHALSQAVGAAGWVVALGDMPYVKPSTIDALAQALKRGADIAVPVRQGRRGNPVAFGRTHLPHLLQLGGDQGARALLKAFPVVEVAVDDAGIAQDIDTEADLPQRPAL